MVVEAMAGVRGILQQETRRVGPGLCAILAMCTRRLLGLVDRSRKGSDPSDREMSRCRCWGTTERLALLALQRDIWLHQPLSPLQHRHTGQAAMHTTHFVAKGIRKEAFSFRNSLRLSGWVSCVRVFS